jgi:hypothetical protein
MSEVEMFEEEMFREEMSEKKYTPIPTAVFLVSGGFELHLRPPNVYFFELSI